MEIEFKTFITASGEYGVLTLDSFDNLFIGTSDMPKLYGRETTIEDLKNNYSNFQISDYESGHDMTMFDWERDIPADWKLVNCNITINE